MSLLSMLEDAHWPTVEIHVSVLVAYYIFIAQCDASLAMLSDF